MRCRLIRLMLAVVPALMCVLMATRSMGEELPHGKWWRMGRAAERLGQAMEKEGSWTTCSFRIAAR